MTVDIDIILAKISIIKKCISAIESLETATLEQWMYDDLCIINLQRAIQASIDLANVVISKYGFELPNEYGRSFSILCEQKVIDRPIGEVMKKMVGFRNISVHEYQEVNTTILTSIIQHHLKDFEPYYTQIHSFVFKGCST